MRTLLAILLACCGIAYAPFGAHAQFSFEAGEQASPLRVGDQLIVNHFVADDARYATHLVITDHEGTGAVVNVLVYDESGVLVDEQSFFLPIFGKVNYNPAERLKGKVFRGTIHLFSDGGNISAQYWHTYRDPARSAFNTAIPAASAVGSGALLCQHVVAAPGIDARLILTNPSADSAVTVSVTFYLDRGKQLTRDKHSIPPNGMLALDPYVENEGLARTGLAYCEVIGHGVITGEYWQASEEERYQVSLPLDAIPVREKHW
ncbi:MAG TPA: hypothetical protein PK916_08080 [Bacteroidota bacterium]|nr:hypothetical protein [Bacteroidota bacterium]